MYINAIGISPSCILLVNNKGCMDLKGGNPSHQGEALPDRWELNADLKAVANRWSIDPACDLAYAHAPVA